MSGESPGTHDRPARIAVVGSGPSGFYAIAALFKQTDFEVEVDLFDRLPTPFGLVRGGVAPDHQNIKAVIRVYNKLAAENRCHFLGNVTIGKDLSVAELEVYYDQIIFAIGNESERRLGIPGEDLTGVHSATEFVGWYNGHPDYRDLEFDLAGAERVIVVGNGNVSMDVTRILAKRPDDLAATDIIHGGGGRRRDAGRGDGPLEDGIPDRRHHRAPRRPGAAGPADARDRAGPARDRRSAHLLVGLRLLRGVPGQERRSRPLTAAASQLNKKPRHE